MDASKILRRALKTDPDNIIARVNLANAALHSDVDVAKEMLAPIAEERPSPPHPAWQVPSPLLW